MTTFLQFTTRAKMRHDYSDMIQVRYPHPAGENFDTWVSGDEVMARLNTRDRERLIKNFSTKNWQQTRQSIDEEIEKGKHLAEKGLRGKLGDFISDAVGDNIFGDTLADNVRGVDSTIDPHDAEKAQWQARIQDQTFRAVALELAWINLEGTLPDENASELDDWA